MIVNAPDFQTCLVRITQTDLYHVFIYICITHNELKLLYISIFDLGLDAFISDLHGDFLIYHVHFFTMLTLNSVAGSAYRLC